MAEQLSLFRDTRELLKNVKVSDELQLWAAVAGDTILNDCLDSFLGSGLIGSDEEALDFLDNIISRKIEGSSVSFRQDLARRGQQKRKVPGVLYGLESGQAPLDLRLGVLSHSLILNLLEGNFPGAMPSQLTLDFPREQSFGLFQTRSSLNLEKSIFWDGKQSLLFDLGKVSKQIEAIEDLIDEMKQFVSLSDWFGNQKKCFRLSEWLKKSLLPVVGEEYTNRLSLLKDPYWDYLVFLTILIWGQAVKEILKKKEMGEPPLLLFKELSILSNEFGFQGGRVDAFSVVSVNGDKLTKKDWQALSCLKNGSNFSIGRLFESIVNSIGPDIEVEPIDLKIGVGDGNGKVLLEGNKILQPMTRHQQQLEQYIFLSAFSWYLDLCKNKGQVLNEDIWDVCGKIFQGRLLYFFPGQSQKEFQVSLDLSEQRRLFIERVVHKWRQAEITARLRATDLAVASCLEKVKHAKKIIKTVQPKQKGKNEKARQLVLDIMDRYRQFVDEGRRIEIIGKTRKGDPIYLLRLRADEITQNGFISCPFPDHKDSHPSTHLWPNKGFYCFSCGRGGLYEIVDNNGHGNGTVVYQPRAKQNGLKKTQALVIPERHHEVLSLVQQTLQIGFCGSPAERYLEIKRRISPELAFKYGAGYADSNIIFNLLSAGLTFQDLVFYGLIGHSSNASPKSVFVHRLLEVCSEDEIRIEKKGFKGEIVTAWPYDVLAGRVTFLLMLGGKITNFYARDILGRSKRLTHRKLSNEHTEISHGAFNSGIIFDSTIEKLIVVEAVIDALTLINLGETSVLAVIGLNNAVLLENLLASGKEIIWALDFDDAGRKQTEKMIKRCEKAGVKSSDFTPSFFEKYPNAKNYDDYNSWWQKEGYKTKK